MGSRGVEAHGERVAPGLRSGSRMGCTPVVGDLELLDGDGTEPGEVETRGVFVKWIEYKTKSGRLVTAPFFIGKTLRRCL